MIRWKNWLILMTTIYDKLQASAKILKNAGIKGAEFDTRYLIAHVLSLSQEELLAQANLPFPAKAKQPFSRALKARLAHQPLSQILGTRLFWGRAFKVTPSVLDPRPETECLIEQALRAPFKHVLDLGTGSGVILLTLLSENPKASGLGVDISLNALNIARQNATLLNLENSARWHHGNWLENIEEKFDLVVANPPYIAQEDYNELAAEIRDWEPKIALCISDDGYAAYRAILKDIHKNLAPKGRVIFEIGYKQRKAVLCLMQDAGFVHPICYPDFDGRDRILCAIAPENFNIKEKFTIIS